LIANRYFKDRFFIDFVALLPLNFFIKLQNIYGRLFYLLKVLRLKKGFEILNTADIMKNVKLIYQKRLNNIIKNDPVLAENTYVDNNRITELI
jgi:hypothetical protein